MPAVSVVVPIWNCARYLRVTIDSVINQTYTDWEMLLVDDGSRDESVAIAEEYAGRYASKVRLLFHPDRADLGVSATRNLGVQHSTGKYIAFLDGDDAWLSQKLGVQVEAMSRYPKAGLCYAIATCVDENGVRVVRPTGAYKYRGDFGTCTPGEPFDAYESFLRHRTCAAVSTVMVCRNVLNEAGGFKVGLKYQVEDALTWTMMAKLAPVLFLPTPLALYRVHSANYSNRLTPLTAADAELEYLLQVSCDSGGMDRLLAGLVAQHALVYWKLDGIPLRLRFARVQAIISSLHAYGVLGNVLVRYAGQQLRFQAVRRLVRRVAGLVRSGGSGPGQ